MPRQSMFGSAEIQRMKDAYELGDASLAKIAANFGVSVPTVSKYLKLAGVEIRPRGRPRKKDPIPEATLDPSEGRAPNDFGPPEVAPEEPGLTDEDTSEPVPVFQFPD